MQPRSDCHGRLGFLHLVVFTAIYTYRTKDHMENNVTLAVTMMIMLAYGVT